MVPVNRSYKVSYSWYLSSGPLTTADSQHLNLQQQSFIIAFFMIIVFVVEFRRPLLQKLACKGRRGTRTHETRIMLRIHTRIAQNAANQHKKMAAPEARQRISMPRPHPTPVLMVTKLPFGGRAVTTTEGGLAQADAKLVQGREKTERPSTHTHTRRHTQRAEDTRKREKKQR